MADEYVLVLTTMPAEGDEAETLGRELVEGRLAACVSVLPAMTSIYRWEGSVDSSPERQMIIKTTRKKVPALWTRLCALHPYDVPEFVVLPIIDGSDAYLHWIRESTRQEEEA